MVGLGSRAFAGDCEVRRVADGQLRGEVLFQRHAQNPILRTTDWPYLVDSVFNPGAALLPDGTTVLLCRAEDRRGISHLTVARSPNGVDGWVVDPQPTFAPQPDRYPEETWGVEDPRVTYLAEREQYAIAYTAYSRSGPGISLALTRDFRTFERWGTIIGPNRQRRGARAAPDWWMLGAGASANTPCGQAHRWLVHPPP